MGDALTDFFKSILAYGWLAGPAFGLLALGESLVLLGIVIPATPILFLVGRGIVLPFAGLIDQNSLGVGLLALSLTLAIGGIVGVGYRVVKARRD
jgi:hypothetical protein